MTNRKLVDRREFVRLLIGTSGLGLAWKGAQIVKNLNFNEPTDLMPSVFVGHGSPMNIVEKNEFTIAMKKLGQVIQPKAILVVSAHWLDEASVFQNAETHTTIQDFGGFPQELYDVLYPANGWGQDLVSKITDLGIENMRFTDARGLDHGTWAVLIKMYPRADVPVVQLSIEQGLEPHEYFEVGRKLGKLRKNGVLIMGSGNIVHNLRKIDWDMDAKPVEWAVEFDQRIENYLNAKNFDKILSLPSDEQELFQLSHPTTEHFIPLLYAMGASTSLDHIDYPCSFIQNASISMRSVLFS